MGLLYWLCPYCSFYNDVVILYQFMPLQKGIKTISLILVATMTIVIIGALVFIVYGVPYGITSELKQVQCNGTIVSMIKTNPCFMTVEVKQQNETVRFDVNYCVPKDDFFKFASVGDNIRKQAGQLFLTVSKKNTRVEKVFDYPYAIE